ncbi:MAG: hypothetical protein VYE72_03285 [Candidatus Thermoplasmatota archaeon]|nr:hypothetical protein [Candidatus Thermoplasmatota archaeon]
MRWALLLVVFLLPALIPMSAGWAEPVGRNGQMVDWTAPNDVYVHQNETVSTYITLHNRADENQALTITPLSVPAPLSTVGLPATELLVPNHLKQVAFGLRAPADAPYQNLTVSFSITSDLSSDVNETVIMNVAIVPRSNLNFGVDDFIAFTVDESVRTAVAVNITNNATLTDDVTFSLYTASTWNWGWNMPDTDGKEAFTTIAPNTLSYVYLWVDVPAVLNGAPLAQTGPRFTLSAVSGLDQAVSTWSFDLLMNEKKNATIDAIEGSLVVAPNEDGRVQAVVRNVGNTPNTLNITLQGLTPEGAPLQGYSAADRFNASGWVVALFGGLEDVVLEPNESRTIEIGFQAPNDFVGEMHVELQVFAEGAKSLKTSARTVASINRISTGTVTHEANGCQAVLPNQSCTVDLTVRNTGNAYNTFVLRETNTTGGFRVALPSAGLLLQANDEGKYDGIVITAPTDSLAFTLGQTTIELIDDTGTSVASTTVQLKIAPDIQWTFRNVEEQVNAKGRLSIAMEVRNDGNAVDGLIVQLQSSHSVDMGFIPPDIAVYEEGVEFPRSFEVNDIPLNSNFTIRAWVQLPQDQTSNGTVYINTTIRSRFAPELPFVHTTTGDYLGSAWQATEAENEGTNWGEMASTAVLYVKAWAGVILSVLVASVILYKAVIDRQRRMDEPQRLPYQETEDKAEDWMSRYQTAPEPAPPPTLQEPLEEVPKATYEAMFRHQHGTAEPARPEVDPALVSAATVVLDRGQNGSKGDTADRSQQDLPLESTAQGSNNHPTGQGTPAASRPTQPTTPPVDDLEF